MALPKKISVLQAIRQGSVGGGESHLLSLVQNLDKTIFEPVVLSFSEGQMVDELRQMKVKVYVLPSTRAFDFTTWGKVSSIIKKENIQLVHAHGTRACTNVLFPARKNKIPFVYTIHGWSFHDDQNFFVKNVRIFSEKYFTSKSSCNISVSASNQLTGKKCISGFDSTIIYNGINLTRFHPQNGITNHIRKELQAGEDAILFGSVARMTIQKNPLQLIEAFFEVAKLYPTVKLYMVGEGDLREAAETLANSLNLNGKVYFCNFRSDVPDVLQALDVFCLPSLWEGMPISLLEAMAMKKPVIATRVDGSSEMIVNDENGLLIEPGNKEELVTAMKKMVADADARKKYAENARKTVEEKYDAASMTRAVETIYHKFVK
jgi:glycosyltransferase involved in cell wall biosynthesis